MNDKQVRERAVGLTIKAKRLTMTAIQERINQDEGFKRAHAAAVKAIESGAGEADILIAAGDAYFAFIKETCGVESQ